MYGCHHSDAAAWETSPAMEATCCDQTVRVAACKHAVADIFCGDDAVHDRAYFLRLHLFCSECFGPYPECHVIIAPGEDRTRNLRMASYNDLDIEVLRSIQLSYEGALIFHEVLLKMMGM